MSWAPLAGQVRGDGRVVLGGASKRLVGEPGARDRAECPAAAELVEDRRVLGRRRDDGDAVVVLGGGPNHRGTAHVDLLDRLGARDALARHRLLERIERDDHEVDRRNPVLLQRLQMLGHVAPGQDPAVDLRVERLHSPVEHLGEPGDLRDVPHRDARLPEEPRGASGGEDLDTEAGEAPRELDDSRLVVHADQRPLDLHARSPVARRRTRRPTTDRRPSANSRTASG
jgi:hypothetical protein